MLLRGSFRKRKNQLSYFLEARKYFFAFLKKGMKREQGMSSEQQSLLPAKRAFVVQLQADANLEKGQWRGRVEHLVSFSTTHFESLDDLLAFIIKTLSELEC